MVIYLYRWKIKSEKEAQFIKAWSYVTEQLRERCGSLGSRLHQGNDGLWYGYAQWPSVETREDSNINDEQVSEARRLMRDATIERLPDIELRPVSDFFNMN
ncbi:MAG: antibiotic biosynthesis monooxygenase [Rhizobacter sp.]|nr:antibiotic biosynthesis monooxygenase [Bacteriovorax sp.]